MLLQTLFEHNMKSVKYKFILIYALNLMDLAFTAILLSTGYFSEFNILMRRVVQSMNLSLIIKGILPALMLIVLYKRMKKATDKQLRTARYIIDLPVLFYFLLNCSHIFWLAWYFRY